MTSVQHSAAVRVAQAHRANDPERIANARRELAEANITKAIDKALSAAPPLNSQQIHRLTSLLRTGVRDERR